MKTLIARNNHGGICDRLALILFGYRISKLSHRSFAAKWPLNQGCGAPFERVFKTNAFQVFSDNPYSVDIEIHPRKLQNFDDSLKRVISIDAPVVQLAGYYGHNFDDFQSVISFSDEVSEIAEQFYQNYLNDETVGLQVTVGKKRTQGLYAPPLNEYMDAIASITAGSDASIFLSTDDPIVINPLRQRFQNRLQILRMRSYDRSTTDSVIDAAVCLNLLRRCKCVVGSSVSGFSIFGGWDTRYIHVQGKRCINTDWWGNEIKLKYETLATSLIKSSN